MKIKDLLKGQPFKILKTQGVKRKVFEIGDTTVVKAVLKKGAYVPNHSHQENQKTMVQKGLITLYLQNADIILNSGEWIEIKPEQLHSAIAQENSIVYDFFNPVRKDL